MHVPESTRAARRLLPALIALLLAACGGDDGGPPGVVATDVRLALEPVATTLTAPVQLVQPPGDARLFIVEQTGRIRLVKGGQLVDTPFLDIDARVESGGERGLLSMAFDPAFATNGHFFVYYTNLDGDIVVERYTAAGGADVASPTTSVPVITIPHPNHANHNGGLVTFGPDGMLYMGTGDGGGGGDPDGNGQDLGVLLGKLLRLDVRTLPYTIPTSNPFVGQAGRRGEIWAYGLRNPWRFTFAGGRLFVADVGQDELEEIDVVSAAAAGVNYGWSIMEADRCAVTPDCATAGLQLPVAQYDHAHGCSIIGGHVYRGSIAALRGHYFYSDYCGGWLESISAGTGGAWTRRDWPIPNVGNVLGFGEDAAGELYLTTDGGSVYRIVRAQ